jgi:hypothetical protein
MVGVAAGEMRFSPIPVRRRSRSLLAEENSLLPSTNSLFQLSRELVHKLLIKLLHWMPELAPSGNGKQRQVRMMNPKGLFISPDSPEVTMEGV